MFKSNSRSKSVSPQLLLSLSLQHYEWAAGTKQGSTDIFSWQRTLSDTSATHSLVQPLHQGEVSE